jgi:integrase/recombinase XerC
MYAKSEHDPTMGYLIDEHLDPLRAGAASPRTIQSRGELLRRLHAELPLGLAYAATDQLDRWLAREGWSRWTRKTYAMHIRSFYRWATARGDLDGDPSINMARQRSPRLMPNPVTDAELARALASGEPWYTVCLLAAYAGLRASEIADCRREHITVRAVLVPNGKGGDPATVPTHPLIWSAVRHRPDGPLIVDADGDPVTGIWISRNARRHFIRVGLLKVRPHRLRHWHATALLESGADLRTVQDCMRHASPVSTAGYAKVTESRRAEAVARLPHLTGTPAEA